jgi:hypothetical protein
MQMALDEQRITEDPPQFQDKFYDMGGGFRVYRPCAIGTGWWDESQAGRRPR